MNILNTLTQKIDQIQKTSSQPKNYPTNCQDVRARGQNASGVYTIKTTISPRPFAVYCDMQTRGGGWTYFLNRFDGSLDFYLKWNAYKVGFGSLTGEHWLGLEYLHQLTASGDYEILVEMTDWEEIAAYALYNAFVVGSETEGYALKALGVYSGDAGNTMFLYAGMKFTTKDIDQDVRPNSNCAIDEYGAWWYQKCTASNPTSRYLKQARIPGHRYSVMYWGSFRGSDYSLKKMRMMVRPRGN